MQSRSQMAYRWSKQRPFYVRNLIRPCLYDPKRPLYKKIQRRKRSTQRIYIILYSFQKVCANRLFMLTCSNLTDATCTGAGITMYSPIKHWGLKPGDTLGIMGLGGLGTNVNSAQTPPSPRPRPLLTLCRLIRLDLI